MTCETSVLVSSTRAPSAETSTCVAAPATASGTLRSRFWPTARSMSFARTWRIPGPHGDGVAGRRTSAGAVNTPASLLVRLRVMPFPGWI